MQICKECIRTYLLGSSNDPHCMNCKTALNQEYLVNNLNRSFCKNEYKDHRTDMLLERELGKMPESMPAAEKQKHIDREYIFANTIKRFAKVKDCCKKKSYETLSQRPCYRQRSR